MKSFSYSCFIALMALLLSNNAISQQGIFQPGDYKDGIYDKENSNSRRFIPYTHLREADVTWEKRVWRQVDVREKMNQKLYYPLDPNIARVSFMQMLLKYVLNGQIIAFNDEEFREAFDKAEIRKRMVIVGDSTEQSTFLADGTEVLTKVAGSVDSTWMLENFASIDIKEDWYFDRQKSILDVRILGLGINASKKGKEELGAFNQFWVYFPACRPIFAKNEVFNVKNDSERRTFDDVFWKRQFSSRILKESNVYDRDIESYAKGIDALLESDRIKQDIFRLEHDLWHF